MKETKHRVFPLGRINYLLLLIGVLCIAGGYVALLLDPVPYGFGPLSLTVGPIALVVGFVIELFAIMYKPKNK